MGQQLVFMIDSCTSNCFDNASDLLGKFSLAFYANQMPFDDLTIDEPYKKESKFFMVPLGPGQTENTYYQVA